jgi:hypothetical protein
MKLYIGIDPGRKGGIAVLGEECQIFMATALTLDVYKDKGNILDSILPKCHSNKNFMVLVEKPRVWPGKPMQNLTKLIRDAGIWEGWCQSYGMQVCCKTPKEWQEPFRTMPIWRQFSKMPKVANFKAKRSYAIVEEIFGKEAAKEHCLGPKGGILDGVADALLMAKYLHFRR